MDTMWCEAREPARTYYLVQDGAVLFRVNSQMEMKCSKRENIITTTCRLTCILNLNLFLRWSAASLFFSSLLVSDGAPFWLYGYNWRLFRMLSVRPRRHYRPCRARLAHCVCQRHAYGAMGAVRCAPIYNCHRNQPQQPDYCLSAASFLGRMIL